MDQFVTDPESCMYILRQIHSNLDSYHSKFIEEIEGSPNIVDVALNLFCMRKTLIENIILDVVQNVFQELHADRKRLLKSAPSSIELFDFLRICDAYSNDNEECYELMRELEKKVLPFIKREQFYLRAQGTQSVSR